MHRFSESYIQKRILYEDKNKLSAMPSPVKTVEQEKAFTKFALGI